ncbi:MAG: LD-carboxypeptidase [Actinomycetota bacterium]|nr:LD-carboxypeptidase [Actinomycetota bacterium]
MLDEAAKILTDLGFVPYVHPQNHLRHHHFAGSVEQRVEAVHSLFLDDSVHGVMAVQGGYGTDHLLDAIDYDLIRRHPKCFVGYSDVSSLLHALWARAGVVSFHGPMLRSFVDSRDSFSLTHLAAVITGMDPSRTAVAVEAPEVRVLRPGASRGVAVAGNLTTFTRLIGTPYEVDTAGAILFVEDVDEQLYTLDRMFSHLRQAGKLLDLKGLMIADFTEMQTTKVAIGRSIDEIVLEACAGTSFPIVAGFPCGHGRRQATLPLGIRVRLAATDGSAALTFDELPVQ